MEWLTRYREDVRRYTEYSGGSALWQMLAQQGLWALLEYRIASSVYRSPLPPVLKRPLLLLFLAWQKLVEIVTGISLPHSASIGSGLYIGHFGHMIVNGNAVIGARCNLSQGVTIGVSGRGEKRGVPVIGNRVYVGANAVVAGKILVGDDVIIGANSLVTRDVPSGTTVLGVPAKVVATDGSTEYIDGPQNPCD